MQINGKNFDFQKPLSCSDRLKPKRNYKKKSVDISDIQFSNSELQQIYDEHINGVLFNFKYLDQINSDIKTLEIFLRGVVNINEFIYTEKKFCLWWDVDEKRIYCQASYFFEGNRRLLETPKEVRIIVAEHLSKFLMHCLGIK